MVRTSQWRTGQLLVVGLVGLVAGDTIISDNEWPGGATDVVFMFDRSDSDILKSRLEGCIKAAAKLTVQQLGTRVNPNDVRVAAVSYSGVSTTAVSETPQRLHFNFNQGVSSASVEQMLERMDLSTELEWTDVSPGYQAVRKELFEKPEESGFRGFEVPVVIILFTDGEVSSFLIKRRPCMPGDIVRLEEGLVYP
jgi:hypothetical protein